MSLETNNLLDAVPLSIKFGSISWLGDHGILAVFSTSFDKKIHSF